MRTGRVAAGGFALAAAAASFALLPPVAAVPFALAAAVAMIVVVTDLERFLIPDSANAALLGLGLALTATTGSPESFWPDLADALLRGAAAAAVLYTIRIVYLRTTGVPGLGLGDVKLAAAAGPWLGWGMLPVALELAALAALLVVGFAAWRAKQRPDARAALPFGAFLAPAIWLCALAGHALGWSGLAPG